MDSSYAPGYVTITFDPVNGLESIRASLLGILLKWWDTHKTKWNDIDAITQCMMQMVLFKIRSLQEAMKGLPLVPNGQKQTIYLDLSNMASITRGLYESAFIYHNIFISTDNEDERQVLINIWKIEGYNNRHKVPVPESMEEDVAQNINTIESLRNATKEILSRMHITESARNKIEKIIKKDSCNIKGYCFVKSDNRIIGFEPIDFTNARSTFEYEFMDGTYSYLSYQSHPSFLSLLQFGQLTGKEHFSDMVKPFLMTACFCATKFTNDACKVLTDGESIKKKVASNVLATINFFENI
ncbi:MAG: hypothetical protein J6W52_08605 [Bacteroidaceae bacterium]|nr:hypothetical protein [Bacteroidaceae bacterium]